MDDGVQRSCSFTGGYDTLLDMGTAAVRPLLLLIARIAAFLVGAHGTRQVVTSSWYVGPIFGLVVLVWYARSLRELFALQSAGFLAASTLIYSLVFRIASMGMTEENVFRAAVAIGTIFLPLAHKAFLTASWRRVLIAVPGIYGLWYALSSLIAKRTWPQPVDSLVNPVAIWQAAYLLFMCWPPRARGGGT